MADLLELYDREQRIEITYPEARKEVLPHLVRFVRPAPGMNFVRYSRLDETAIDEQIAEQIAYFRPIGQPFSWTICSHDQPRTLKERLVAHGFQREGDADAVMVLDLRELPTALNAPVTADIRRISTVDQLGDVIAVLQPVWGGSFTWMPGRLGPHLAILGYLSMYVAYVDGHPASAAWTYFEAGSQFALLRGGSTLPERRKHGLYTALLAIRAREAAERGYRYLVIEASDMSRPIVAKHGFQFLTVLEDYQWGGE
jgi:hypothetical protein